VHTDLTGRVAVVLGGSRGIGRATARDLAANGASVTVTGRADGPGADFCAELREAGHQARFQSADLLRSDEVTAVLEETQALFGRLDICVSSGAPRLPLPKPLAETDAASAMELFTSRFTPRLWALFAAGQIMSRQGYGKIVLLTTDAGRIPTRSETIAGSAAAAVIFLTRAAAREFASAGVRINAVSTTLTRQTPSFEAFHAADTGSGHADVIHQVFAQAERRAAFGLNQAADVAALVVFLCSPESDQVSGATVSINGGLSFPAY
jgi:2-hydroxycyclohexanecarboxyl-CoA dehydrogenase